MTAIHRSLIALLSGLAFSLVLVFPSLAADEADAERSGELDSPPRSLQISADTVDMKLQAGRAEFAGNVVVLDSGLRIESEAMEVRLNEQGEMTEAVFSGTVRIAQEEEARSATAERAVYSTTSGELVLTGKPVLKDGERTLRNARKIIYNRRTGRIRTEGTRDGGRPTLTIPLAPGAEPEAPDSHTGE